MNPNEIAKKGLEWFVVATAGFYFGVAHTANLAYGGIALPPEWYHQVAGYEIPIFVTVVVGTALWVGLDYFEYKITQ